MDAKTKELVKTAAVTLRAQQAEIGRLRAELDQVRQRDLAVEVATLMDARGITDSSVPLQTKVSHLLASKKDLRLVKEAVASMPADMTFARATERDSGAGSESSNQIREWLISGRDQ
jgi:hypothetical protein